MACEINRPLILLALIFMLGFPGSGYSQMQGDGAESVEKLALEDLIEKARQNAPDIKAAAQRVEAAQAQLDQALWAPFSQFTTTTFVTVIPEKHVNVDSDGAVLLESEGHRADDLGFGSNEIGPYIKFKIQGGIPIYTFGKISGLREAAEYGVKARKAEVEIKQRELDLRVRQAYWGIKLAREILYTLDKGRGHLDDAVEQVEQMLDDEDDGVTEIDLIKLRIFRAEVDRRELDARLGEKRAVAALNFLAGDSDGKRVDADEVPLKLITDSLESLDWYRHQAAAGRPELKGMRALKSALKAKVDMRRGGFYPDFLIVGEFGVAWAPLVDDVHNPYLNDPYNSQYWGAGLSLKWDLDFGLDAAKLDEAKAELRAMSEDERTVIRAVFLEVEEAYLRAMSAHQQLETTKKGRRLAKSWLAAVLQGFAAGVNDTRDLKDALVEFFSMYLAHHQAVFEYNTSTAKLLKATGRTDWKRDIKTEEADPGDDADRGETGKN